MSNSKIKTTKNNNFKKDKDKLASNLRANLLRRKEKKREQEKSTKE